MSEGMFGRRDNASQAAFTDNTGGAKSNTIAVGAGYAQVLAITIPLADLANAQEYQFDPGYAGEIISLDARVSKAVTTGAKAATLTARVNAGAVGGGGVVGLTSANCTPIGAKVAGSAITGAKAFAAGQSVGFAVSGVTTFTEGEVVVEMLLRNTDLTAFLSAMADKWGEIRQSLIDRGLWKGSA